jgi:preprotein translocase subunit SecA
MPEGEPIEAGIVTRSIESAQRKVEARNFDVRKQLLEYDDVANDQRKVIYQQRNELLEATDISETIGAMRQGVFIDLTRTFVPESSIEEQWDLPALEQVLRSEWQIETFLEQMVQESDSIDDQDILAVVLDAAEASYLTKVEMVGREGFSSFERSIMLQTLDSRWREHLAALDHLRQGIHLRGYAQKNPKQEYKREAFELFSELLDSIKQEVTRVVMNVQIQSPQQLEAVTEQLEEQSGQLDHVEYQHADFTGGQAVAVEEPPVEVLAAAAAGAEFAAGPKVGRNDPCPCGSGKKYKQCHGKLG